MSRGGKRVGAGRPANSTKVNNTDSGTNDYKFDVIKEQIDLYKKLKKQNDPKTLTLRASLLKDIGPYLNKKMPTANDVGNNKEVSTIEIIDVGNDSDGGIV